MLKDKKKKKNHKVWQAGHRVTTIACSTMSQVCGTQEGESITKGGTPNRSAPIKQPPKDVL